MTGSLWNKILAIIANDEDNDADDEDEKVERPWKKETEDFRNRPKLFFFSMVDGYVPNKDPALDDYLNNFKITSLVDEGFIRWNHRFM
jgi:hypothetical protein